MGHAKSYVSPLPKIHPVLMIIIYSLLLGVCCGPAYNSNGFKAFIRLSGFLISVEDSELLLSQSHKVFQSADIVLGAVVGIAFELFGPRICHSFGYFLFSTGFFFMMYSGTLYWAMGLQGAACAFTLATVMHLANLFEHRTKFAMSVLTSAPDLGCMLFPGINLAIARGFGTPRVWVYVITSIGVMGLAVTLWLFPDSPYFPKSIQCQEALVPKNCVHEDVVYRGVIADVRDRWGDLEGNKSHILAKDETSHLLSNDADSDRRPSSLSISVIALKDQQRLSDSNTPTRVPPPSLWSQLCSIRWLFMTIIFTFFIFRAFVYFDSNEDILRRMGDSDGSMTQLFAFYLSLSFIPGLLNGIAMEFIGVMPTCALLNLFGICVNLLSITDCLDVQRLTFVLFMFSKASSFSILYSYTLEEIGIQNFLITSGMTLCIGGLINQIGGLWLLNYVHMNGTHQWDLINWILTVTGIGMFGPILILHFLYKSRRSTNKTKGSVPSTH